MTETTFLVNDCSEVASSNKLRTKQLSLLAMIVAVIGAAAVVIIALIAGDFSEAVGKSLLSLGAVFWFSLLALFGTFRIDRVPRPILETLSLVFAVLGIATALLVIWVSQSEIAWRAHGAVWVFAFAAAHASLLVATRNPEDGQVVCKLLSGTVVLITLAAALIAVLIMAGVSGGAIATITMIVLVLDGAANVMVFLMRRFLAPAAPAPGSAGMH